MITTGVTGLPWRASIAPSGAIEPWDGVALNWYIAADDRWHIPAAEPAVRQHRVEGTAVTETRVRVPNGDVVQRVFSVPDGGGVTVVEIENESTMPVAIAFDRSDVLTDRPIADVPIEGIELPSGSFIMPLGHRATLRVGLAHTRTEAGPLPALPTPTQVVRGWLALTERASRFVLPDGELGATAAQRITAERCELALGVVPHADRNPAEYAVALGELVRMGESPEHWIPELVDAVERLGPRSGWDADVALDAAGRVLVAAGERRARTDLDRIVSGRRRHDRPEPAPDGVLVVPWLETLLADRGELLPAGLPTAWVGQSIEAYGLPTVAGSTLAYAIRWHGERPALLWEQSGDSIALTSPRLAPSWSTNDATGETLWPPPPGAEMAIGPDADPSSFS